MKTKIKLFVVSILTLLTLSAFGVAYATFIVPQGGTSKTTFGQGWIFSPGGVLGLNSSTSPTVAWITATSTVHQSIFPYASTTALTVSTTASTTNLIVSSTGGSGTRCLQVSGSGVISANASACSSGSSVSIDWKQGNNVFSVNSLTPTTTIPIDIKSTATSTFAGGLAMIGDFAVGSTTNPQFYVRPGGTPALQIGTSSSFAKVAIHANNNDKNLVGGAYTVLFQISSSTASATTSLAQIDNTGKVYFPSTASSGATQTGYWCYDGNGQLIRDTVTCLISALKFKKDVTPINAGLDEVLRLTPVNYYLKNPMSENDKGEQFGFIADEAEKVDPRLVTYDANGDVHGYRYEQYTAVLTKAIQELDAKVENKNGINGQVEIILIIILGGGMIYQQMQIRKLKK